MGVLRVERDAPTGIAARVGGVAWRDFDLQLFVYAALLATLYGANVLFAFGYNVGDTHVFYLPSHVLVALFAGLGAAEAATAAAQLAPVARRERGRCPRSHCAASAGALPGRCGVPSRRRRRSFRGRR